METPMLHLIAPSRDGKPGMIAGDACALSLLRAALDEAIESGATAVELFSSDGEPYELLIAAPANMWNVHTAYAGEADPVRSGRERLTMEVLQHRQSQRRIQRAPA